MKRGRDARVLAEGESFRNSTQSCPKPCHVHEPTIDELKRITFSDYVRFVVLKKAEEHAESDYDHYEDNDDDDDDDDDDNDSRSDANNSDNNDGANDKSGPVIDKNEDEDGAAKTTADDSASAVTDTDDSNSQPRASGRRKSVSLPMASSRSKTSSASSPGRKQSGHQRRRQNEHAQSRKHSHNTRRRRPISVSRDPLCEVINAPATKYVQGMAKVRLPKDLWPKTDIGNDQTARGPNWEAGTELGSFRIPSPIKQCIRGIGGIYEYTFLDMPETTVSEFREKADAYIEKQVRNSSELMEYGEEDMKVLERKFWKRLGPTMQPSMYGADMEGTLFGSHTCQGWNISRLESCLQLLLSDEQWHESTLSSSDGAASSSNTKGIPGVTTPYLYFGMWASVFCAHTEDMNLLSINYLHAGAPKVWYAVAPGEPSKRLEAFCGMHYHESKTSCDQYLRHKRCLLSPQTLRKAGIPFTMMIQYPGDTMITFPGGYHFGFNAGFNVAEATNFAVPEWVPYGKLAGVCMCRPDSVSIDMHKFSRLLVEYDDDQREEEDSVRLSWKDWAFQLAKKSMAKRKRKSIQAAQTAQQTPSDPALMSKQQLRKEFWIEIMAPPSASKRSRRGKNGNGRKRKQQTAKQAPEMWHLAKPLPRKMARPATRVLCILPVDVSETEIRSSSNNNSSDSPRNGITATGKGKGNYASSKGSLASAGGGTGTTATATPTAAAAAAGTPTPTTITGIDDKGNGSSVDMSNKDEEDEQCFAGCITETSGEHVRIHLDGFPKKEDVWMEVNSPKLHLDGGQWAETETNGALPKLHYWKEGDSKRQCT